MTIIDIAKLANVSTTTVSRVLNKSPNVGEKTRAKIQKIIDENHFVPNYMGSNLRSSKSGRILVVLPTIATPAYAELIQSINSKANSKGYSVMFVVTGCSAIKEKEYLSVLETKSFEGAILVATTLDTHDIEKISKDYPVVVCNTKIQSESVSYATIDNKQAAYDVTKNLIAGGHKNIAVIKYCNYLKNQQQREAGYREAMAEAGLAVREGYVLCDNTDRPLDEQFEELFSKEPLPSAIVSFADLTAVNAMKYASRHNIPLGTEIEVVGFGNVDYAVYGYSNLSVLSIPWYDLGENAFDLLLTKIKKPGSIQKGIIMPHKFIASSKVAEFEAAREKQLNLRRDSCGSTKKSNKGKK